MLTDYTLAYMFNERQRRFERSLEMTERLRHIYDTIHEQTRAAAGVAWTAGGPFRIVAPQRHDNTDDLTTRMITSIWPCPYHTERGCIATGTSIDARAGGRIEYDCGGDRVVDPDLLYHELVRPYWQPDIAWAASLGDDEGWPWIEGTTACIHGAVQLTVRMQYTAHVPGVIDRQWLIDMCRQHILETRCECVRNLGRLYAEFSDEVRDAWNIPHVDAVITTGGWVTGGPDDLMTPEESHIYDAGGGATLEDLIGVEHIDYAMKRIDEALEEVNNAND